MLNIWKGRESGPYMHTLHFMFGIGAFIAPVIGEKLIKNFSASRTLHTPLLQIIILTSEKLLLSFHAYIVSLDIDHLKIAVFQHFFLENS